MKPGLIIRIGFAPVIAFVFLFTPAQLRAQYTPAPTASTSSIPDSQFLYAEALAHIMQASTGEKPLILQVGSHMLFAEGHIAGSEYIGPGSQPSGLLQLQNRVRSLSRKKFIVIYCGCCPWSHCPNLGPAYATLREMGFTNVKALYLPYNFGADWAAKGYPVERGY